MELVNLLEAGLQVGDKGWMYAVEEWAELTHISDKQELHFKDHKGIDFITDEYGVTNGGKFPYITLDKTNWEIPTKKPEPDWTEIFTLDKPFMVRDTSDLSWRIGFAAVFLPSPEFRFIVFGHGVKQCDASCVVEFKEARELTPEEREKYLK